MESLRRGKLCRHGEWFTLIKFTNEVHCNGIFDGQSRFVGGQVFSLQRWKDSDSVKEQLLLGLLWVRIPRLLLKVWTDTGLEAISKVLFVRVFLAVDLSKTLKMEIRYRRDGILNTCLSDYENITDIFYEYGSQDHKFDSCALNYKYLFQNWERGGHFSRCR